VAALLQERRAESVAAIAALRREFAAMVDASESSNADDEHDPEGATIAFERAQVAALIDQAVARVHDLDLALGRLHEGSYGHCETCGEPIAPDRLAARPAARTCVGCARLTTR
jgi:RNA polymerase-binding transcription factor DksA